MAGAVRTSLSLPYSGLSAAAASRVVVHEGWVLKKRRKKMQGFARRYFTLYQSGLLTYSMDTGQPVRDQISLHQAAISTAPGRKDIHLDSNTATFHIKCLSMDDFNQWMTAFRKFVIIGAEVRRTNSVRLAQQQGALKLVRTGVATGAILDDMATAVQTLEELEHAVAACKRPALGRHKSDKEKTKESHMFGLFSKKDKDKNPSSHSLSPSSEVAAESTHSDASISPDASYQRISELVANLKNQHASLLKLQAPSFPRNDAGVGSAHASPLTNLPTTSEENALPKDRFNHSMPAIRAQSRMSIGTAGTDSLNEWYDADDGGEGAQEFVLELSEEPSRMVSIHTGKGDSDDGSSVDTDIAEEELIPKPTTEDAPQIAAAVQAHIDPAILAQKVARRAYLPAPVVGDEGSLFQILKKNVGKDLSTIALPVSFNEPLTLLQRAAEEVEYFDLLAQAAAATDPVERMRFVAAFAVSSYAHTRYRTGRKGFNPMLAETYEDPRMKFIAEKVRHNPVEMAYHAEGENWEMWATSAGRTKFWGKSLEIIPLGGTHVRIGEDHFSWKKPSSFMRNLMMGTKYLEHVGQLVIENAHDGAKCVLEFKQTGYFGASNQVAGVIYSGKGSAVSHLEGKWDEQLSETVDPSHLRILWRAAPWPKETQEYYGFTSHSMTLNEITTDLESQLPPTDSRFRPDVKALEDGNIETADAEKIRVEELQRERRRNGKEAHPKWFKQDGDEWVYKGGYWEARAKAWKGADVPNLW
ncbi:hypothetical protein CYLTODRAFT_432183 [Cylindrobasidium torrendii FP15055 ss-10]|uniref:PH domain-containing protein n=1 Tax=Cylindrobasidium torrendii FP15055 ss-10 TaxID=1314674 RepID=A0A0D7B4R9_9AGAR|nr:hypothetical protein CYLTODRAFT_432183 [Cylindrobasidium torrendii FP15055 ss-10]